MPDDSLHNRPAGPPGADRAIRAQHLDLEALSAAINGTLPPDETAAAHAHLASCPDCANDLAEMRATVDLLRNLPLYDPPRSFTLGPEHARPRGRRRAASHAARPTPGEPPTLPASRPTAPSAEVPGSGWGNRLLPNIRVLQVATALVSALFLLAVAGDLVTPDPVLTGDPARFSAPVVERAGGAVTEVVPGAPVVAPADQEQPPANANAAGGTGAGSDASQPADATGMPQAAALRASPWRVAQLALGVVLLWLVVSLAGRLIIDRHERMPG